MLAWCHSVAHSSLSRYLLLLGVRDFHSASWETLQSSALAHHTSKDGDLSSLPSPSNAFRPATLSRRPLARVGGSGINEDTFEVRGRLLPLIRASLAPAEFQQAEDSKRPEITHVRIHTHTHKKKKTVGGLGDRTAVDGLHRAGVRVAVLSRPQRCKEYVVHW